MRPAPAATTEVLVVRHGQSTWNAHGRWQGLADPPLSRLGQAQAHAAVAALAAVDLVVASDLQRALATARRIAEGLGRDGVRLEPRFREIDAGPWTGLTRAEIEAEWPGWLAAGRRPPGFESREAVATRAHAALVGLHVERPGAMVAVVTHAGVIRSLERSYGVDGGLVPNLGGRRVLVDTAGVRLGERVLLIDPDAVAVTTPSQL